MRKCLDCGAELADVDMICKQCGSANLSVIEPENDESEPKKKFTLKTLIMIVCTMLIIAIAGTAIVIGGFAVVRNTQTEPVTTGIEKMMSGDLDGYVAEFDTAFQETVRSVFLSSTSADDYQKSQIDGLKSTYGENYKIYVSVIDVSDVTDTMVAALNKNYSDYEVNITEAKYVTVKIHIIGDDGLESLDSRTVYSVKINDEWTMFEDFSTGETAE